MTQAELLALIDRAAEEGWTELDLLGKGLTELPPEIGKLTQLETLILGKWEKEKKGSQGFEGYDFDGERLMPLILDNLLTELPPEIKSLENLRQLHLSGNRWNNFPLIVTELKKLEKLTIVWSTLTEIPEAIAQLTDLISLDLGNNQITVIPDAIAQLSSLTSLDLAGNQITAIPDAIAQLSSLTSLSLSRNQITVILEAIAQLSNLTSLDFRNNQIAAIPGAIAQLSNLTSLDFRNNQITVIPDAIAQLSSLTSLNLNFNQITAIPEAITQLSNLTSLHLSGNQITAIPEAIAQLSRLALLDFGGNQITVVPDAIAQLSSLTSLHLSSNQITVVPEVIAQLSSLTSLSLSSNQITVIPEAIAQLSNLTSLSLSSNQITVIPEAIAQLSNLTSLYLMDNQITVIPEAIAQLSNLTLLYLWNNQIMVISEAITQLFSLTSLNLSRNQITVIPEAIAHLSNLTSLNLSRNQIRNVPSCLEDLSKLTKLDLRRNPLSISPEILGSSSDQSPGRIFNYLRELRTGEKRQLNEAKLLLIGQGSVGKTSLINRLIHNHYNPNESQTDGLNVSEWPLEVNGQEIRLNVWDFGGQEIYHATHQFFLTKRSLYILTCNCRTSEDENRIEYWLKLIQSFGGESPVIIVGNKADEQPLDINRKALRDKYPNIKAIIEASCATGQGIDELREKITYEVSQLSDVYNLLPLTWFKVKEQLEAMDQDFISYPQYTGLCYQQNVTEEQSQEQLIDLLHNLGLVLNFRDHPILKDTNVLNPDWVTTGIYAILSDEALKTETKGILTDADLTRILDSERYPAIRHPYLTELIQEFQLGFPLITPLADSQPKKFLLPSLLPKDEPENTNLAGDTLDFQYHYRILPESILSRFIVLTHEDIHEHTYWRSGVMLHHQEGGQEGSETYNIARVKADLEDKKIFIAISGKASTRRTFLTMLRKTFNKIHSSFANPEVTEWVPVPDHPDHPPLDYKNMLGLEKMNVRDYPIGTLGISVNIRKLLDGYETLEARVQKSRDEMGKEGDHYHFYGENPRFSQQQGDNLTMSEINNNLQGANIGNFANEVKDGARQQANQHNHPAPSQNLTEAVRDIKALFAELDQSYDKTTPDGQDLIEAKAIKAIETSPTFKKRVVNALKEGGAAAIEVAVDHPATKPVLATIKGFMDA